MSLPAAYAESTASPLSAVQKLLDTSGNSERNLALQIAHNLRYQHGWTELHLHALQVPSGTVLISGRPPNRLYVHPDEQIELLQQQKKLGKTGMPELSAEHEWVVPSHLREKWTLRRFGDIFDAIDVVPSTVEASVVDFKDGSAVNPTTDGDNPWRTTKRFLLATLDDDSTIVYYVVHDGIVKPRQN